MTRNDRRKAPGGVIPAIVDCWARGAGQIMVMQLPKQRAETDTLARLLLDLLAGDLAPAERFVQSCFELCGHKKSLFRLIPSFKLTERLIKIESDPDVNTAC